MPKLRFPEFRDAGEWDKTNLGKVASFFKGKGISKADIVNNGRRQCIRYGELYTRYGEVIEHVFSRTNASDIELFLSQRNDVIIPASGETKLDIAKASCVIHDGIALGSDLNVIRTSGNGTFLSYYLNGPKKFDIAKVAQGDTVVHLYPSQLEKLKISIPGKPEQKKIADCLSSLDKRIAAQARKVVALQTHKKGLMQKLFPCERETTPQLRFPEFRSGEWKSKKIGTMLLYTPRPIEMEDEAKYSLVTVRRRYGGVTSREVLEGKDIKVKSQFIVELNDFLISKRQIVHNACGLVPSELHGSIVSNEYSVLTPRKGCDIRFFNYFSQQPSVSESFRQASVGIVIEKMLFKLDYWLKLEFHFPHIGEQRRIADCLTSLDELLTAQTQRLESLQSHKKGLMQQLFPSTEAVEE